MATYTHRYETIISTLSSDKKYLYVGSSVYSSGSVVVTRRSTAWSYGGYSGSAVSDKGIKRLTNTNSNYQTASFSGLISDYPIPSEYASEASKYKFLCIAYSVGGSLSYTTRSFDADLHDGETGYTFAVYVMIAHTVTFDKQGGKDGTSSLTLKENDSWPRITPPTKDGAVFEGYYTATGASGTMVYDASGNPKLSTFAYTKDVTLYARWKEIKEYDIIARPQNNTKVGSFTATQQSETSQELDVKWNVTTRTLNFKGKDWKFRRVFLFFECNDIGTSPRPDKTPIEIAELPEETKYIYYHESKNLTGTWKTNELFLAGGFISYDRGDRVSKVYQPMLAEFYYMGDSLLFSVTDGRLCYKKSGATRYSLVYGPAIFTPPEEDDANTSR